MRDKAASFFFTNFPETWDVIALWKMFDRYDKVVDIYIAFKRTIKATRFGFVRFINIGDIESFERRLKGIIIGNSKLVINRAKYVKAKPRIKTIPIEENAYLRTKLECCWIGEARNFHVLQNAWSIMENNDLVDCKIKYLGGLSFIFEWGSKEVAMKSLEENKVWLHQWFNNIKIWDNYCGSYSRLAWIIIDGLPPLGRNINSVKAITKEFGRTLEVDKLDFDSKILLHVKALVHLPANLNVVNESVMVLLNGIKYPVRILEEQFQASSLLSPLSSDSEGEYVFEEEYIGPSLVKNEFNVELFGESSSELGVDDRSNAWGNEKSLRVQSACNNVESSRNKNSKEDSYNMDKDTAPYPTPDIISSGPDNLEPVPEPIIPLMHTSEANKEDNELEDLMCSFPRLSEKAGDGEKSIQRNKRKSKQRRKKLIIGRDGGSQTMSYHGISRDDLDNDRMTKNIGEMIGFSFITNKVIFEDFNVVSSRDERSGCGFNNEEANAFNDFVTRNGLFDFPFGGRRFSRFDKKGKKASKLDRFLVSHYFFNNWDNASVFDKWISDVEFRKLVYDSWGLISTPLMPNLCLKNLRLAIKSWTSNRVSNQQRTKEKIMMQLVDWDVKAEAGLISDLDHMLMFDIRGCLWMGGSREEWMMDLSTLDQMKRDDLRQKCRLRWAIEGDENTRFFHSILKNKLSSPDISFLEASFSMEEHFETSGNIANGCNPSFVVLIPKKGNPLGFSDYRPISLIGCVYKVISKLLASRLAKVIDTIIGPNQSSFIKGRQILDGCLIVNEIIRMASLEKQKLLLFKVDFKKAFDSVNWGFILDIMRQIGFRFKWRKWISSCLSLASISVLINGSPSKEFKMERGLRQGDPLSPYLFLLVVEALQVTILEACRKGVYNGVSLEYSRTNISLLQYADDALFFGEWSRLNAYNLIRVLKCFEKALGLKDNIDKSRLYGVGVSRMDVEAVASSFGCEYGSLPFIYLGLLVGSKMNRVAGWNVIVKRIKERLSSWKAKTLSIGGRLTLIRSILSSLPIFYLSLFKAPMKIINLLESIRSILFWGFKDSQRRISWVKWKLVLLDKETGGLGVVISEFYGPDGSLGTSLEIPLPLRFIMALAPPSGKTTGVEKIGDRWICLDGIWSGNWAWRSPPRGRALDEFTNLVSCIGNLTLDGDGIDKWSWADEALGIFKFNTLSKKIQNLSLNNFVLGKHHYWNSWIPRKVNICVWRASLDRLPSRANLSILGIVLSSTSCPFCDIALEDIEHSLGVFQCSIWAIWKWRNKLVTSDSDRRPPNIMAIRMRIRLIYCGDKVTESPRIHNGWEPKHHWDIHPESRNAEIFSLTHELSNYGMRCGTFALSHDSS
ncbi:putative RNA-directed DNA polymerase, eukaryota, reverse transcriptase zinc-binding domain protein [Tanacetum coccineum]